MEINCSLYRKKKWIVNVHIENYLCWDQVKLIFWMNLKILVAWYIVLFTLTFSSLDLFRFSCKIRIVYLHAFFNWSWCVLWNKNFCIRFSFIFTDCKYNFCLFQSQCAWTICVVLYLCEVCAFVQNHWFKWMHVIQKLFDKSKTSLQQVLVSTQLYVCVCVFDSCICVIYFILFYFFILLYLSYVHVLFWMVLRSFWLNILQHSVTELYVLF